MPIVSIGMPLYNGEPFLASALSSILAQSYTDFELIVSDNASTDGSMDVVQAFAARDSRIRIRRSEKNLGAAANYNVLVELARGKYFKWAAHDDILAPDYLARCVEALDRNPDAVLAYPATVMIDERGTPTDEDPYDVGGLDDREPHVRFRRYMERAWPRCGCNAVFGLIRTDLLKQSRLIGAYASSDKILLGELALLGRFIQLPDPLFLRREHTGSSVRANPDIAARNLWFDTSAPGSTGFPRWKWLGEYAKGIVHVPVALLEKSRSLWELRRHVAREQDRFAAELKRPVKTFLVHTGLRKGRNA
jgi:glycosyltransferase involved in cell wall biosynthesis